MSMDTNTSLTFDLDALREAEKNGAFSDIFEPGVSIFDFIEAVEADTETTLTFDLDALREAEKNGAFSDIFEPGVSIFDFIEAVEVREDVAGILDNR